MQAPPRSTLPDASVVVMGVSGSGKSTLARSLATALGWRMIEGDDFHDAANQAKMRSGIALDDADRAGWLRALAHELHLHREKAVLSCSALKLKYRQTLRAACPQLRFIFLDIPPALAAERAKLRTGHFFDPSLVASQFEALESPVGEPGVLRIDAALPMAELPFEALRWIRSSPPGT